MPKQTAQTLGLPHRVALALLRESGRLWLARMPGHTPDIPYAWDFSARGQVPAGEAGTSAAALLLREALGLPDLQPVRPAVLPPLVV